MATSNQHSKLECMVMMKILAVQLVLKWFSLIFLWRSQNWRTIYATAIVCHPNIMSRRTTCCLSISQLSQRVCLGQLGVSCCCTKENMFLRRFLKVEASLALSCCIACIKLTSISCTSCASQLRNPNRASLNQIRLRVYLKTKQVSQAEVSPWNTDKLGIFSCPADLLNPKCKSWTQGLTEVSCFPGLLVVIFHALG